MLYSRGGQPAAHAPCVANWTISGGALQLGKIFQMKNVQQLLSRCIGGGQPVADCILISSDDLFFLERTAWFK